MKRKKILSLALALSMLAGGSACQLMSTSSSEDASSEDASSSSRLVLSGGQNFDNVIVVIGDGMGENHILNAITYFDLDIPVFLEDQCGYLSTRSADQIVTDSAAGGTALATGTKVPNGRIARYGEEDLEQITTVAKRAGMRTGVITTDLLSGATPAAFSAHAHNRNDLNDIMATQATSDVDLLIGQSDGAQNYYSRKSTFEDNGYTMATSVDEMTEASDAEKLIALLPEVGSEYIEGNEEDYQLKDMAKFAVEYLENDDGFFLMIEGAYIDKYSHNNQLDEAMSEMRSLIDTIAYLYEYASDGDTAIFITADHETGGLKREENKEEMDNFLYSHGGHTATNVPLFVKNYRLDITDFDYEEGDLPENTIVFQACKAIIED